MRYDNYCYYRKKREEKLSLTLLHSEKPKLHAILVFLSAIGLNYTHYPFLFGVLSACIVVVALCPWKTAMVMSEQSVNPTTLFLGRLSPP